MILSENRFTLFGTMRRALSDLPQACLSGRATTADRCDLTERSPRQNTRSSASTGRRPARHKRDSDPGGYGRLPVFRFVPVRKP